MAKVTQPLGSSEARGSVGGLTYNTWRGIRTVKARSGQKDEPTQKMLDLLAETAELTLAWQSMSQAHRTTWNAWAATRREPMWTGQDKRLTGYNWWVRLGIRQSLIGLTPAAIPPEYAIPHTLLQHDFTFQIDSLLFEWELTIDVDPEDYWVEIYLTPPLSAGRNATLHDALRAGYAPFYDAFWYVYTTTPGTYTIFVRLLHKTGLVTPFQSARTTIPPP